jgi:DNA topoisomerase VI subunit B
MSRKERRLSAMTTTLQRITYAMPRAAEYFSEDELRIMTGQHPDDFGTVVLKELLDNAIDATEHADALKAYDATETTPLVQIGWDADPDARCATLTVADNGVGIPPETVMSILDFATRTSDKALYRSPTRGAQGNAAKTILGIPYALGLRAPVVIEARGVRHTIAVAVDPSGTVHVDPTVQQVAACPGTRVTVPLPHGAVDLPHWGRAFALFNPHVTVKICQGAHAH